MGILLLQVGLKKSQIDFSDSPFKFLTITMNFNPELHGFRFQLTTIFVKYQVTFPPWIFR